MSFTSAVDLALVLYALIVMLVYVLGSGYFLYPATALLWAVTFEALGWHGWGSVFSILRVMGWIALGAVLRRASGRSWFSLTHDNQAKAIVIAMGLFSATFLPVLIASGFLSAR